MNAVFADTFYWIALTSPMDAAHERAKQYSNDIVTTEEVLTEYLNFFCSSPERLRCKAAAGVGAILQDRTVRVIPQSHQSFLFGLELYTVRRDKGYSLTDCISMQATRRECLTDVLTNDRHFEQEGFRALLRDS